MARDPWADVLGPPPLSLTELEPPAVHTLQARHIRQMLRNLNSANAGAQYEARRGLRQCIHFSIAPPLATIAMFADMSIDELNQGGVAAILLESVHQTCMDYYRPPISRTFLFRQAFFDWLMITVLGIDRTFP